MSSKFQVQGGRVRAAFLVLLGTLAMLGMLYAGLFLWASYTVPNVRAINTQPIAQPGGVLRQIAAPQTSYVSADWSPDGSQVVFLTTRDWSGWSSLGGLLPGGLRSGFVAVADVAGGNTRVYRLPRGGEPSWVVWRTGASSVAVSINEPGGALAACRPHSAIWLYELPSGKLARRLHARDSWPVSWSPDGKLLLCTTGGTAPRHAHYWVARAATGEAVEVTLPKERASVSRPRWAPDSRSLVFLWWPTATFRRSGHGGSPGASASCHEESPWTVAEGANPTRGLWMADAQTGKARLQPVDPCRDFAWLPDGRILFFRSRLRDTGAATNFGLLRPDAKTTEWLAAGVPGTCWGVQCANGRIVVALSEAPRAGGDRHSDLYEFSLRDCSLHRLTTVGYINAWTLSPHGKRILIEQRRYGSLLPRGLWVLDIGAAATSRTAGQGRLSAAANTHFSQHRHLPGKPPRHKDTKISTRSGSAVDGLPHRRFPFSS